jgi:hypothetical protein
MSTGADAETERAVRSAACAAGQRGDILDTIIKPSTKALCGS